MPCIRSPVPSNLLEERERVDHSQHRQNKVFPFEFYWRFHVAFVGLNWNRNSWTETTELLTLRNKRVYICILYLYIPEEQTVSRHFQSVFFQCVYSLQLYTHYSLFTWPTSVLCCQRVLWHNSAASFFASIPQGYKSMFDINRVRPAACQTDVLLKISFIFWANEIKFSSKFSVHHTALHDDAPSTVLYWSLPSLNMTCWICLFFLLLSGHSRDLIIWYDIHIRRQVSFTELVFLRLHMEFVSLEVCFLQTAGQAVAHRQLHKWQLGAARVDEPCIWRYSVYTQTATGMTL